MEKIHTSPASHCCKYDGEVIGLMLAIMTTITVFDHTYSSKSVHSTLTRKSGIDVVFAHTNCDSTLIAWVWVHTTKTNFIYFMCFKLLDVLMYTSDWYIPIILSREDIEKVCQ